MNADLVASKNASHRDSNFINNFNEYSDYPYALSYAIRTFFDCHIYQKPSKTMWHAPELKCTALASIKAFMCLGLTTLLAGGITSVAQIVLCVSASAESTSATVGVVETSSSSNRAVAYNSSVAAAHDILCAL